MHDLERVRAYVEGTLPPEEREAFAVRLRSEPELAELAEAYGLAAVTVGKAFTALRDLAINGYLAL